MFTTTIAVGPRVELQLQEHADARQYRELALFVRCCVDTIERDTGRADWWSIKIVPDRVCYSCDVIVQRDDVVVHTHGHGFDGAVAGRDAFNKAETLLREQRAGSGTEPCEVICGCR